MTILRVALAVPLYRLFDYRWQGDAMPAVGQRVRVPFGSRQRIGVIVAIAQHSDFPEDQIKPVLIFKAVF